MNDSSDVKEFIEHLNYWWRESDVNICKSFQGIIYDIYLDLLKICYLS